jgi:hypothetical protein
MLNISNAGFLKGDMAYGNLKQTSASTFHLRFKIKKCYIAHFKCLLLKFKV